MKKIAMTACLMVAGVAMSAQTNTNPNTLPAERTEQSSEATVPSARARTTATRALTNQVEAKPARTQNELRIPNRNTPVRETSNEERRNEAGNRRR